MEIITNYQDKDKWNEFVAKNSRPASFLQSWEWGEFNKHILGNSIERWAVINHQQIRVTFLLIKKKILSDRFYYYSPRGIVWQEAGAEITTSVFGPLLKKISRQLKGAVFVRMNPPYEFKDYMYGFLKRLGFNKPKILVHAKEPGKTLILDLSKTENKLLSEMHHKTRYNIKLAQKKGVKIRLMNSKSRLNDIGIFYKLACQTAKRNKINIYAKDYYAKLINYFCDNQTAVGLKLYVAEFKRQPLAVAIVVYFGQTAAYLHGASSSRQRELMPNHLMQWQMIKDAKAAGMRLYDFWGISEHNRHWAGITRFKKGFGGETLSFLGSWDYILNKRCYNLLRLLKVAKKIIPF